MDLLSSDVQNGYFVYVMVCKPLEVQVSFAICGGTIWLVGQRMDGLMAGGFPRLTIEEMLKEFSFGLEPMVM